MTNLYLLLIMQTIQQESVQSVKKIIANGDAHSYKKLTRDS